MVQVKVRSKGRRRTKNTSRKTAPFTQLAPQVNRNRIHSTGNLSFLSILVSHKEIRCMKVGLTREPHT